MSETTRNGKPLKLKRDEAAGGLVAQLADGRLQVVLIAVARGRRQLWALPKGHFKKKESARQTALREVREETGLEVEILRPLGVIDYWFVEDGVRYHKFVEYFVMRAVGGHLDHHDDEVTEARWFDWSDAVASMSYDNERALVESARDAVLSALAQ